VAIEQVPEGTVEGHGVGHSVDDAGAGMRAAMQPFAVEELVVRELGFAGVGHSLGLQDGLPRRFRLLQHLVLAAVGAQEPVDHPADSTASPLRTGSRP
jgi:hypothetical protein